MSPPSTLPVRKWSADFPAGRSFLAYVNRLEKACIPPSSSLGRNSNEVREIARGHRKALGISPTVHFLRDWSKVYRFLPKQGDYSTPHTFFFNAPNRRRYRRLDQLKTRNYAHRISIFRRPGSGCESETILHACRRICAIGRTEGAGDNVSPLLVFGCHFSWPFLGSNSRFLEPR